MRSLRGFVGPSLAIREATFEIPDSAIHTTVMTRTEVQERYGGMIENPGESQCASTDSRSQSGMKTHAV
jgi:hypothetical protein